MIILPAIDLKDGQCVRLLKGDFATVHKVAESPRETAKMFQQCGAQFVHVVDLDGSLQGKCVNHSAIGEILEAGLKVELGGGIRNMETMDALVELGVARLILGSAALKNPAFVKQAVQKYGEKIAVGIDAKDGYVAAEGWLETSTVNYLDFAKEMEHIGVKNIIFTDISRDGTLEGPNLKQLSLLAAAVACDITASGGIKDLKDIRDLKDMNLYGAIAGKAIYSKTLDLVEAVALAK